MMKNTTYTFYCLMLTALVSFCLSSTAQVIPALVNYQAAVFDANGQPLANSSYTAKFRIYDADTGGTIIWAEQQTVTVNAGEFSVILGQGTQIDAELHGDLRDAFNGNSRYLGLTVLITGQAEAEIVPRQQFLSTAYAMHAANIDTGGDIHTYGGNASTNTTTGGHPNDGDVGFLGVHDTSGTIVASLSAPSDKGELRLDYGGANRVVLQANANNTGSLNVNGTDGASKVHLYVDSNDNYGISGVRGPSGLNHAVVMYGANDVGTVACRNSNNFDRAVMGASFDANPHGYINLRNSAGTVTIDLAANTGNIHVNGALVHTSSARYKHDIQNAENDFKKILNLNTKSYIRNSSPDQNTELGLIAEEVDAEGIPDLLHYDEEGRPDGVKYSRISLHLLEVIKDQQETIEQMSERLEAVETKVQ